MRSPIRPYITVIVDSFREALASRVLWILLAGSTLVLLALAPIGLTQRRALALHRSTIQDWPTLIVNIKQQSEAEAPSPGKRIWELASNDFKKAVTEATDQEGPPKITASTVADMMKGFNELIKNPKLYDEASWREVKIEPAAEDLLKKGVDKLSSNDLAFVNRLLIVSAYRTQMLNVSSDVIYLSYFHFTTEDPLPFTKQMTVPMIKGILGQVMGFFVGTIGVFVAILVTAPMVPRTFEAGAVDLLMSKPVSRSLLFISKFIGGCAFILLNAGYFIFGLWLIVGLRFGIWSSKLLLCIPIFLFLFSIYYCVSTLAGVLWKNAIVSVVVTIVFWTICFVTGQSKFFIEQFFLHPQRIVRVTRAADSLIGVNQSGEFLEWQAAEKRWERILQKQQQGGPPNFGPVIIGPLYDETKKELTFIEQPPFAGVDFFGPQATLVKATWSGVWQRENGPLPPGGTSWLFRAPDDSKIVVASEGVFRWDESAANGPQVLGMRLPFGGKPFIAIGPRLSLAPPVAAAMDAISGDIAIYSSKKLNYLKRAGDGTYTLENTREFEDFSGAAVMAVGDQKVLIASSEGSVFLLNGKDLKTIEKFQPFGTSEPFLAAASDNGDTFAVLFHSGRLWLLNPRDQKTRTMGKGISAVLFDGPDHLLAADRGTRISRYEVTSLKRRERFEPPSTTLQLAYRWVVMPVYTVLPKPGAIGEVVNYVLTERDTAGMPPGSDPRQSRIHTDVYTPIWTSMVFVAVIIGITCWLVQRADL